MVVSWEERLELLKVERISMSKDRTKKIFNLLEKGKSVRDISGRLGVSTKTVVKVRKYWDKPRKEYVEGLENQPLVSSSEFVDIMR